jgi:hypothetical protein
MAEHSDNPIHHKIVTLDNKSKTLQLGGLIGEVEYTSDWEKVEGGKDVECRTLKIKRSDINVDGADIIIKAGGYTPIQMVNAVEVVVDAPEKGKAYCCVMDKEGNININYFDGETKQQMVWAEGMTICWIAVTDFRFTEFESPSFNKDMFTNLPEDNSHDPSLSFSEYLMRVNELRERVRILNQQISEVSTT